MKKSENIIKPKGRLVKNNNNYNRRNEEHNKLVLKKKKKQLESIEIEIEFIENLIDELDKDMLKNSTDAVKLNEISIKQTKQKEKLNKLLKEWENVSEELDSLS